MKRSLSIVAAFVLLAVAATPSLARHPEISWDPSSFDFGTLSASNTSTKTFTLENDGRRTEKLKVSINGAHAFTIIADDCDGQTLDRHETCDVSIQFTAPGKAGRSKAELRAEGRHRVIATARLTGTSNRPPDAVDDTFTNIFDTDPPFDYGWLGNDSDPDGDPFLVTAVTQPDNIGSVSIVGGGTGIEFDNTINQDTGANSFTYTITDSHGASDTATVNMYVQDLILDYTALCVPLTLGVLSGARNSIVHAAATASRPNVEVVVLWDDATELGTTISGPGPFGYNWAVNVTIPAGATLGPHVIRARERGNAAQPYIGCNEFQIFTVTP